MMGFLKNVTDQARKAEEERKKREEEERKKAAEAAAKTSQSSSGTGAKTATTGSQQTGSGIAARMQQMQRQAQTNRATQNRKAFTDALYAKNSKGISMMDAYDAYLKDTGARDVMGTIRKEHEYAANSNSPFNVKRTLTNRYLDYLNTAITPNGRTPAQL